MALAFATRYKAWHVLVGITVATAVVHAFSVLLGGVAAADLPTNLINVLAGLAFFGFAVWTLHGDTLTEEEESRAIGRPAHPSWVSVSRSSWRSWETRPCWPQSPSPPPRACSARG